MTAASAATRRVRRNARRAAHPAWLAAILTAASLVVLSALSVTSTLGSVVAIGAAALLLLLICLGLGRTAEVLVVLGAFMVPMNDLHTTGPLSFVTAADAAFALGFALMFPDLVGRPLRLPAWFAVGATGVFFIAVISSLLSDDPMISLNATSRLVVGAFGITVLLAWWNPDLKRVVTLAWAYVLGNVVSAVYAMVGGGTSSGDGRRVGLTEHPNFFGLCALLAIAFIPFLLTQTDRRRRWILVVAGLVCFWGLWTSGSRAALVALILVAVIYPLLSRSTLAGLGLLTVAAVTMLFSSQLQNEAGSGSALGRLLGGRSSTVSDESREEVATAAFDQFLSHPILGVGLVDPLQAHIIYLQIMAALGVVGLVFFLLALSATVRPVVTLRPPFNFLALPALSYVIVGFVTSLLWDRYIWVPLAIALIAPRLAADETPADEPTQLTPQPAGVARHRAPGAAPEKVAGSRAALTWRRAPPRRWCPP